MLPKDFYYDENADQEIPMKKLPTFTKIIYGFGDIGFSMTGTIIAAYFPIFLKDVIGISPAVAAIALFIGKSWDYINDPLIGHLSDRTRSRWGRRRPFLLFGALPYGLVFAFLWLGGSSLPFSTH
jgi:GPH family glycoside/pentoside/hexuronide:cation symporter